MNRSSISTKEIEHHNSKWIQKPTSRTHHKLQLTHATKQQSSIFARQTHVLIIETKFNIFPGILIIINSTSSSSKGKNKVNQQKT